jgi:hypothetical protein
VVEVDGVVVVVAVVVGVDLVVVVAVVVGVVVAVTVVVVRVVVVVVVVVVFVVVVVVVVVCGVVVDVVVVGCGFGERCLRPSLSTRLDSFIVPTRNSACWRSRPPIKTTIDEVRAVVENVRWYGVQRVACGRNLTAVPRTGAKPIACPERLCRPTRIFNAPVPFTHAVSA